MLIVSAHIGLLDAFAGTLIMAAFFHAARSIIATGLLSLTAVRSLRSLASAGPG